MSCIAGAGASPGWRSRGTSPPDPLSKKEGAPAREDDSTNKPVCSKTGAHSFLERGSGGEVDAKRHYLTCMERPKLSGPHEHIYTADPRTWEKRLKAYARENRNAPTPAENK